MKITHSASRHAVSHHPVVYCFVSIQQQVLSCYSLRHHSLLKAKWFECEYDVIAYAARILLKIPAPLNIKRLPASLVECNTVPKSLMKHLISAWSLPENTELWDASNIKSRLNNYSWSFLFCVQMCFLTSFFAQTHQSYCLFFFFFLWKNTESRQVQSLYFVNWVYDGNLQKWSDDAEQSILYGNDSPNKQTGADCLLSRCLMSLWLQLPQLCPRVLVVFCLHLPCLGISKNLIWSCMWDYTSFIFAYMWNVLRLRGTDMYQMSW